MVEELLEHEINNIPQSPYKDSKNGFELYHGIKLKFINGLIHQPMWCYHMTEKVNSLRFCNTY